MRYYIIYLLLFISVNLFAHSGDQGVLAIKNNNYDFGRVMENGGKVRHRFTIENKGKAEVLITNVRSTCGCTSPQWSKDPIAPGKKGFVDVVFDPEGQKGSFRKTIQILSNAQNSNMFVTLNGTIVPAFEKVTLNHSIGNLQLRADQVNLGFLYKGNVGKSNLIIANTDKKALKLKFKNVPDYIDLKVTPEILQPGDYGEIEVYLDTKKTDDWDVVLNEITVVQNRKTYKDSKLIISANIREDFRQYTPDQLQNAPKAIFEQDIFDFDTLYSNKLQECKFKITNKGQSDLIIRAVKPSCGCTAVKPEKSTLSPGDYTYIDAVFDPKERRGEFKNSIAVVTNDPQNAKQFIYVQGYIKR